MLVGGKNSFPSDLAIGPYEGKGTGENALLRGMVDTFDENDVVVFDRHYCSYMMLAMLVSGGAQVCVRLHQRRPGRRGCPKSSTPEFPKR